MNILDNLVLDGSKSILDAMCLIERNARGIVFITINRKLIGVATDGDIRRSILNGSTLESNIQQAMNTRLTALPFTANDALIRKTFSSHLKMIPLINKDSELVDVADAQRSHRIPLIEPDLSGRELEYVSDCIETNWISSQGSYVKKFEEQFEAMHPDRYALAVSNGTVALHLALHALGVGEGDEVIVPDLTFAATINAVLYCKAVPVLCEIDANTLCIDVNQAVKLVTSKTKAILPVHLYGFPCDMDAIEVMTKKYNLLMIEDCAEALGSMWRDKPVGTFGSASTFSFFGNKTISTGEGGMILFERKEDYEYARILRDHGMTPGKKYWHEHVGFNYRLTNIQAAIGVAQMERIRYILDRKLEIANHYANMLNGVANITKLPPKSNKALHSNWLFTIILNQSINRDLVIEALLKHGVEARPVFFPLHQMPPYSGFRRSSSIANSKLSSRSGISLPSSVTLANEDIAYVVDMLNSALQSFSN